MTDKQITREMIADEADKLVENLQWHFVSLAVAASVVNSFTNYILHAKIEGWPDPVDPDEVWLKRIFKAAGSNLRSDDLEWSRALAELKGRG